MRWRFAVHALDRTGPPVLARSVVRWLVEHRPEDEVDVVALRGGDLVGDLVDLVPVRVLVDPGEPDGAELRAPERTAARLADLAPADVTVVVSVSAAGAVEALGAAAGRVVTWVVEVEEDYPTELVARTQRWWAGATGTAADVRRRLGDEALEVDVVGEFVDDPTPPSPERRDRYRRLLGPPGELAVVGCGIATWRKGVDLFAEVAAAVGRTPGPPATFTWIGGAHDPLFHPVRDEAGRAGAPLRLWEGVADVDPWFAAADVFCHTARQDAFPLVCLHAAALGVPVVGWAGTSALEEMFGPHACTAPYPDIAALAARVRELADPDRGREVGESQRRWVLDRHVASAAVPHLVDRARAAVTP